MSTSLPPFPRAHRGSQGSARHPWALPNEFHLKHVWLKKGLKSFSSHQDAPRVARGLLLRQDRCLLLRQDRCLLLRQDRCLLLRQGRYLLLRPVRCLLLHQCSSLSQDYTTLLLQNLYKDQTSVCLGCRAGILTFVTDLAKKSP